MDIVYSIYGAVKDASYWNECLEEIKFLPPNISVEYYSHVSPDKVEEILKNNHIYIQPSKSENFGHSIYEALSAGRPVITSNATPWNNLEISKAGININPENTKELTSAIEYFASMNNDELEEWSRGATQYAEAAINFDEIKQKYEKMFCIEKSNLQ